MSAFWTHEGSVLEVKTAVMLSIFPYKAMGVFYPLCIKVCLLCMYIQQFSEDWADYIEAASSSGVLRKLGILEPFCCWFAMPPKRRSSPYRGSRVKCTLEYLNLLLCVGEIDGGKKSKHISSVD